MAVVTKWDTEFSDQIIGYDEGILNMLEIYIIVEISVELPERTQG